jgi:transposase
VPARPYRPRDKAKVEAGVLLVERWILARLRKRTFFSLGELNAAIAGLLAELNRQPFQKLPGSRLSQFEAVDQPALRSLPPEPYAYGEWRKARVGLDYHVAADGHFYSVPCALVRQQVDLRLGARTIEVFHKSQRVASHRRNHHAGGHSTQPDHRPESHAILAAWTPDRLRRWAQAVGPAVQAAAESLLATAEHPEQGLRSGMGLRRLAKRFSASRLEAACERALGTGGVSYASLKAILSADLDLKPLPATTNPALPSFTHANIRGPEYYRTAQEKRPC